MKAIQIEDFIENIKNIPAISSTFEFIWYELPKKHKNWAELQIIDFNSKWDCFDIFYIEFRIIWRVSDPQIKVKSLSDIIDENIIWNEILNYNISLYDYSKPFMNKEWRFEVVRTYQVF